MEQEKKLFALDREESSTSNQNTKPEDDFSYIYEDIYKPVLHADKKIFNFPCPVGLEVRDSTIPDIGVGVFATQNFKKGQIVERVKTIILAWRSEYHGDKILMDHVVRDTCECYECKKHGNHLRFMTGFGTFYNHQTEENCHQEHWPQYNFIDVIAKQDIKIGQELFTNYGPFYFKNRNYKQSPSN